MPRWRLSGVGTTSSRRRLQAWASGLTLACLAASFAFYGRWATMGRGSS